MHDICSSVPFYLGYQPKDSQRRSSTLQQHAKAVSGNMLLFPLYAAACTDAVSDMMRAWVAGRMSKIAEDLGIGTAAPLAKVLSEKKFITAWEINDI
jgi:hypothetical protein